MRYDVFVSYRRSVPQGEAWVRDLFYPTLVEFLRLEHKISAVFLDDHALPVGGSWPDGLRDALRNSRVLLALLSAEYFGSDWCRDELGTALARQRACGARVVFPVRVWDGHHYPDEVTALQMHDLHDDAVLTPRDRSSRGFRRRVRQLANELAEMVAAAPEPDPEAEIVRLDVPPREPSARPRFS